MRRALPAAVLLALATPLASEVAPDYDTLGRIRDEGFRRSQVMAVARHLTDAIGPRLTGSPAMRAANEWTKAKFEEWGLADARLEPYEFGEGWSFERSEMRQVRPAGAVIRALPKAWSVPTNGPVRGLAMQLSIEEEKDLEEHAGQLRGRILLVDAEVEREDPDEPTFERWDAKGLEKLAEYKAPEARGEEWRERRRKQRKLWMSISDRLVAEGVVALVDASSFDYGAVRTGGIYTQGLPGLPAGPPQLTMAMEPYERILRLLEEDVEVELEIQVDATFHRESNLAWNTLAEIPGTAKAGEVVMAGAHLDSWHPGTGATDNAAGSAVVMEAMRILQAIGVRPKRTIRAALWSGEEQGLVGSRAYVEQHFASRPEATDAEELALPKRWRRPTWPITARPEHRSVALYLNLDNGGGRVRGIYAQENLGAKAKFERWIEPLEDLGVTTVTMQNTAATDHTSFDGVGIPGFQLVQDARDYESRTHHSDLDTFDRLEAGDLKQAAVVLASLLYQAAMDETPFPRKPMPKRPEPPNRRPESPAEKAGSGPPAAAPVEKPAG